MKSNYLVVVGLLLAATGVPERSAVLFIGGSENPYNYDGIGYNDAPAEPVRNALLFNLELLEWEVVVHDGVATMDHRALVPHSDGWMTVGGMLAGQQVTDAVISYSIE